MFFYGFRHGSRQSVALGGLSSIVLALATLAQSAPAQTPQPSPPSNPQVPTLSVTTREVLLDVVVTDGDGRPVTGLTAADFTIKEEGDLQRLAHLEEHHPMSQEDLARLKSAPALPPNTFSNFLPVASTTASTVILLDALDTSVQTQMELREQLIDYLKHMQPGTPIAIFQVDTEMRLIQSFSTDPQVLLDAAKSKRDMPSLQKPIRGSRDEYRRIRLEILRSGFRMMGRYLAGFPGRKNLVWFTGAIPGYYLANPLGSSFGRSFRDEFSIVDDNPNDLTDALTLNRVAVYPIDARGLQTAPQYMASNSRRPSPGANMRFETAQAFQHMDLASIADQTGGRAYDSTNGLKQALGQIVENGSNYYTLAYATTNQTWSGQLRHIKVTLDRPGLRLQYRQGYYAIDRAKQEQRLLTAMEKKRGRSADNPFGDDDSAVPDANEEAPPADAAAPGPSGALVQHPKGGFAAAMQLGAIPPTEVIFTAGLAIDDKVQKLDKSAPPPPDNYLSADFKGKPFRTLTLQILANTRQLRFTRTAGGLHHGKVEIATVVYNQTGNRVNAIVSTASLDVSVPHYRQLLASGLPVRQQIAVPVKGNFFLRVGVHDAASDHIGALEIPVDEIHPGVFGQGLQRP
jgi:VWFA-related protein